MPNIKHKNKLRNRNKSKRKGINSSTAETSAQVNYQHQQQQQQQQHPDSETMDIAYYNDTGKQKQFQKTKTKIQIKNIQKAINEKDLVMLKKYAGMGSGLINNKLRKRAWPLLLKEGSLVLEKQKVRIYQNENQIHLDTQRTRLYKLTDLEPELSYTKKKQLQLFNIINKIYKGLPELAYYQGFHQVCLVLLTIFGNESRSIEFGSRLALFYFRDAMACNFALITKQLQYINGILLLKKPEIADLFNELEIPPFYAISWVLTWFAHDISDFSIVARLYDFFLVHHPSAVLYVSAALVSFHWPKILNCEREFPEVHSLLSKLPKLTEESDWMSILSTAEVWMLYHPYTKLQFVTQQFLPQWSSYNTFEKTWMQLEQFNPVKLCEILDQETLFHNLQTMPDKTSRFAVVSQNINVAAPRDISLITQYVYNAFVTSLGYTPKWVTEDKNKSNYKTIVAVAAAVTTSVSAYLLMVGGQALLNKGYFG